MVPLLVAALAVSIVLPPIQIPDKEAERVTVGLGCTVTSLLADAVHPLLLVTVTVYVVFANGETEIAAVVGPVFHTYVPPPLAVRVAVAPLQIVTTAGAITATGNGFTVTVTEAEAVQLLALVTVTV